MTSYTHSFLDDKETEPTLKPFPIGFYCSLQWFNLRETGYSLKLAKTHMHVYCFHGKHFTCCDLRGMLETDNFACKDSK